jgi:hypothetical protein
MNSEVRDFLATLTDEVKAELKELQNLHKTEIESLIEEYKGEDKKNE